MSEKVPDLLGLVLYDLAAFIRRFVIFQEPWHADVVALWVAHTWAIDQADATMYLVITSPQKGSGKTRLLEVLEQTTRKPWRVTTPSEAVLFRYIHLARPTLLLDETDAVFAEERATEGIRAVLNVGNRRGATVPRATNAGGILTFQVFGAKALCGIGYVHETLADRSITIPLVKKLASQTVEPFIMRRVVPEAAKLRDRLEKAVGALGERVAKHQVEDFPAGLTDRQRDGWDVMFAIADLADGDARLAGIQIAPLATYARELAVRIHAPEDPNESDPILLLRHLRDIFDTTGEPRLPTITIINTLIERDDGPWAGKWNTPWDEGKRKASADIAKLLRPFGVRPTRWRVHPAPPVRGYVRKDLEPVWARDLGLSDGTDGTGTVHRDHTSQQGDERDETMRTTSTEPSTPSPASPSAFDPVSGSAGTVGTWADYAARMKRSTGAISEEVNDMGAKEEQQARIDAHLAAKLAKEGKQAERQALEESEDAHYDPGAPGMTPERKA